MKILVIFFSVFVSNSVYCYCPFGILAKGVNPNEKTTILRLHNEIRQRALQGRIPGQPKARRMPNLLWDDSLAQQAQIIADSCEFRHQRVNDGRFQFVGQNLALTSSSDQSRGFNWNDAVSMWYDEYKNYKFSNQFDYSAGHYTQLVWADTKYVGCGSTFFKSNNGGWYEKFYVCNYGPGGNIAGQYPYERA